MYLGYAGSVPVQFITIYKSDFHSLSFCSNSHHDNFITFTTTTTTTNTT